MKYCTTCGTELVSDAIFCTKCGIKQNQEQTISDVKKKNDLSWQIILEILFTIFIPLIGSVILYGILSNLGRIIPSQNNIIGSGIVIGIILLFVISWILWAIGKFIGKRLSNETGLVLGIVLIVLGFTLYIGIPIIIYSRGPKEVRII